MSNRRRAVRFRASLRFTFSWDEGFELFRTFDISTGGARVLHHVMASPRIRIGTHGEAAFVLDGVEVRTEAVVVRELDDGFAVRFVSIDQTAERRIAAWVFRQEVLWLRRAEELIEAAR